MLDSSIRKLIDPPLNRMGHMLARTGVSANGVTLAGLVLGLLAAALIASGAVGLALIALLLSRLADGLDGAVARATRRTDFGGYFDIAADFLFYGAIPFGFALLAPSTNAVPAAFLLLSFYFNGTSFLGFAIMAEKRKLTTDAQGLKNLYYSGGLLEGTETIGFFVILCLLPTWFPVLAWIFGVLCFFTALTRILHARKILSDFSQDEGR